jgi:hypothetical protein
MFNFGFISDGPTAVKTLTVSNGVSFRNLHYSPTPITRISHPSLRACESAKHAL